MMNSGSSHVEALIARPYPRFYVLCFGFVCFHLIKPINNGLPPIVSNCYPISFRFRFFFVHFLMPYIT